MNEKNYDDMINLPCPTSPTHPRMPIEDRAAQFAPFSALTGYGDAIDETERQTEERIELGEEQKDRLDRKMALLMSKIHTRPQIQVTYFVPDVRKEGGVYRTVSGQIKRVELYEGILLFADGVKIPIADVYEIEMLPL